MSENYVFVNSSETIVLNEKSTRKPRRGRTKEEKQKAYDNAVARLKKAVEKDGGRYIEFVDRDGGLNRGILVAGVSENRRLYFAYLDKNRCMRQASQSDTYRLMRDIPVEFSVIDYLYRHEFKDFKNFISDRLEETGWELMTEIHLREPRFKKSESHQGNRKRNNFKKKHNNKDNKKKD
jgi:hypothetical protein